MFHEISGCHVQPESIVSGSYARGQSGASGPAGNAHTWHIWYMTGHPYWCCRFGKALCQRLMEVLRVGQEAQKPLALQLLRHLFQSPSIHLGPPGLFATDGQLFAAVAALLQGPLAAEALQVCCSPI